MPSDAMYPGREELWMSPHSSTQAGKHIKDLIEQPPTIRLGTVNKVPGQLPDQQACPFDQRWAFVGKNAAGIRDSAPMPAATASTTV
jgi:hypothetical protein